MYAIRFAVDVVKDLRKLSAYRRKIILEAIETQLSYEPISPTKNRKLLVNLVPPWDAVPPIWELRVEGYRVFYDVAEEERTVYVRAVRRKPPGRRTGEIL
ncbi:MAG: type II toxin-antitoxin system RelE family toxin [Candidatus Methylomirabilales bacterium]